MKQNQLLQNNTWTTEALSLLENDGWTYTLIFKFSVCYTQKFNENNHKNFKLQFPGQSSVIRDLLGGDALGMMGLSRRFNTAGGVKGSQGRP